MKREAESSPERSIKREGSSSPEPAIQYEAESSPEPSMSQSPPKRRQPAPRNSEVYVVLYEQHYTCYIFPTSNSDDCMFRGVFRNLARANQEAIKVCSEVYGFWESAHDEDSAPCSVLNYGVKDMSLRHAHHQDSKGMHMIQKWLTRHGERQVVMHDVDEGCIHTVYVSTQRL